MASALQDREATCFEATAAELLPIVAEAGNRLAVRREIPLDVEAVVDKVADRIPEPPTELEHSGIDPYLAEALTFGVMRCYRALRRPARQARPELRIGLEQVRQALAYIVEEASTSEARPVNEIAAWLAQQMDTRQSDVAAVLGVAPRTLHRWCTGVSIPAGQEAARLRMVARLVNNLRHAMTAAGALLWLQEPHADLAGRAPVEFLDDAQAYPALLRLAARARSHAAS